MNFHRLLVPVDFSYHSETALRLGLALANQWKASLAVLHVDALPGAGTIAVEPVYVAPQVFEGLHAEHDQRVEANLAQIARELRAGALPGVDIAAERRRGDPREGIVAFAREWRADLIVIGSQGASGAVQLLLGSTAEAVSRIAPCPVLIAGRADDREEAPRKFRRVLAAIDYSRFSGPVAQLAAAVAERGGTVELLHMWNPPYLSAWTASLGGGGQPSWFSAMTEKARAEQAEMIAQFARDHELRGVSLEFYVGTGHPAMGILERAEETGADLIVLGAHGRRNAGERLIGTVADRVLRHTELPVLVCPEDAVAAVTVRTLGDTEATRGEARA